MALEQTIDTAIQRLVEALAQAGPKATEVALAAAQAGAINDVFKSLVVMAIGLVVAVVGYKWARAVWTSDKWVERGYSGDNEGLQMGLAASSILCGFGCVIFALASGTMSMIAWIGIFRPEVYLAAKLLRM